MSAATNLRQLGAPELPLLGPANTVLIAASFDFPVPPLAIAT
jgi:hypothetical protein